EQWMVSRLQEIRPHALGHARVQQTDAQSLAYALADSPVGMAAWIWARRRVWSASPPDPLAVFDRDFLCTTASIYWLTRTIGSSTRLYREYNLQGWVPRYDRSPIICVPTGIGVFPDDIVLLPRSFAERDTNLVRWTVLPRGGHYPPADAPELVIEELTAFF